MGNPLVQKGNVPSNTSFDNVLATGIYAQNYNVNSSSGLPSESSAHGTLVVFNCGSGTAGGGNPVVQIFFQASPVNSVYIRSKWVSTWRDWVKVTTTTL